MRKIMILGIAAAFCTSVYAEPMKMSFCSGAEHGGNAAIATNAIGQIRQMDRKNLLDVQNVTTAGSVANLEGFNDGTCNIAITQADGLQDYSPSVPFKAKAANSQYVFWMYNKKYGITDLSKMKGSEEYGIVIVRDSGMQITMKNFALANREAYAELYKNAVYEDTFYDAMNDVNDGFAKTATGKKVKIAGTIYVTMPGYIDSDIAVDFGAKVGVGNLDAGDFSAPKDVNGDQLYVPCTFGENDVKGFDVSNSITKQDTVCMSTMIVYPVNTGNSEINTLLKRAINKSTRNAE